MKKLSAVLFFCLLLVAAGCDNYKNRVPDTKVNREAFETITGFAPDASVKKSMPMPIISGSIRVGAWCA